MKCFFEEESKTKWHVEIINPLSETGEYDTYNLTLGAKATKRDVQNALLRMYREDGKGYKYYEQDVYDWSTKITKV